MATPNSNQNLEPMQHNGRPAGGGHVESGVPGGGAYDARGTVNQHIAGMGATGSNVTPDSAAAGSDSDEVLESPPWMAMNPNAAQWMPPLN